MNDSIFISIKEEHIKKIINGEKNYEFRNYIPKKNFSRLIVYVPNPIKEIKYILEIGEPIKYPSKIIKEGIGNDEFNKGYKTQYAYPILKVSELKNAINLEELKGVYFFSAPQAFAYADKYLKLYKYLEKIDKIVLR